jgi:GNAT superfamily N-acetyltransferase
LLRLDRDSRRLRFAHAVSDTFIEDYASRMSEYGSLVYGYLLDGQVRGAAELRRLGDTWGEEAEAAFSVEKPFQDRGVGSDLMGRVVRAARNRRIKRLYMSCLAENARMQVIARKHEAALRFEYGEVIGEILPEQPNYFSIMAEAAEDRVGFMIAVLELQSRMVRAA